MVGGVLHWRQPEVGGDRIPQLNQQGFHWRQSEVGVGFGRILQLNQQGFVLVDGGSVKTWLDVYCTGRLRMADGEEGSRGP